MRLRYLTGPRCAVLHALACNAAEGTPRAMVVMDGARLKNRRE
jgi:hypothetical protein